MERERMTSTGGERETDEDAERDTRSGGSYKAE